MVQSHVDIISDTTIDFEPEFVIVNVRDVAPSDSLMNPKSTFLGSIVMAHSCALTPVSVSSMANNMSR
jgi:hypothetical protein